jgi:hypothetical protein
LIEAGRVMKEGETYFCRRLSLGDIAELAEGSLEDGPEADYEVEEAVSG